MLYGCLSSYAKMVRLPTCFYCPNVSQCQANHGVELLENVDHRKGEAKLGGSWSSVFVLVCEFRGD
jgi:hypothetical protein